MIGSMLELPEELATFIKTGLKNKISDMFKRCWRQEHEFMMVVEAPQWSKWG